MPSWTQRAFIISWSESLGSKSRNDCWIKKEIVQAQPPTYGDVRGWGKATTWEARIWGVVQQLAHSSWTLGRCSWTSTCWGHFPNRSWRCPLKINTSSTLGEITPLTALAPMGVSEERIQEMLRLQQANLKKAIEKRFLAERIETNLLIKKHIKGLAQVLQWLCPFQHEYAYAIKAASHHPTTATSSSNAFLYWQSCAFAFITQVTTIQWGLTLMSIIISSFSLNPSLLIMTKGEEVE